MIFESQGLFGLSNPYVTSHISLFMIFDTVGIVCVVESIHHPSQHVVDDL
jgi:hypothetical protein